MLGESPRIFGDAGLGVANLTVEEVEAGVLGGSDGEEEVTGDADDALITRVPICLEATVVSE